MCLCVFVCVCVSLCVFVCVCVCVCVCAGVGVSGALAMAVAVLHQLGDAGVDVASCEDLDGSSPAMVAARAGTSHVAIAPPP